MILFFFWGCGTTSSSSNKDSVFGVLGGNHTKPKIILKGEHTIILHIKDTFTDPGAIAFDEQDGDISSSIETMIKPSPVNTNRPGKYEIIYSVVDSDGNKDTKKRKVVVLDTLKNPEALKPSGLVINEVLSINGHTNLDPDYKQFSDWIELLNNSSHSISLNGYRLSDGTKTWHIPSKTMAPHERVLVWADKQARGYHTNFSLDGDGEKVILSKNGTTVDEITFKKQKRDISVTKINGENYYMIPTPGIQNSSASNALAKSKKPDFDYESGFYKNSISVKITQENHATIYYTLDGSIPVPGKTNTMRYTHPLSLSKSTVLRASALESDKFLSSPVTHTYLINENVTLPVMSVTLDEAYLYNPEYGIYTAGNHTNYNQDWIRPGSVEYIKEGKTIFSKNIGIKIHGNNTRSYPQKSLALYTKSQFGTKAINYPLFTQKPYIKKIKSFVLRSGGTEWGRTLIGDGIQHTIVRNMMDIDYHAFGPSVVVFLNGKYWGLHHIREKMNADYLAANHGVDPKNVDLLANDAEIKKGDNAEYLALKAYIRSHDLSQNSAYAYVKSKIDLQEYMNYIITESFTGNGSIHHNIKYWKERNATGKWRWMLFDLDRGFRYLPDDAFKYVADADETSIIFRNLLKNKQFVHAFASRYFTHLNTTFQTQRIEQIITAQKRIIEPEVARHFAKWSKDKDGNPVSVSTWQAFMDDYYTFAQQRGALVREDLRNNLDLSGNVSLTINKTVNGTIKIDDVPLYQNFLGRYFSGATVTLKAIPDSNSAFVRWSDGNTNATRTVTINTDMALSAIFHKLR